MKRLRTSIATVAVATVASGGLLVGLATSASASTNPPWEPDGSSAGSLTFYDSSGHQITGGNTTDSPLAAYVQGSATVRTGDSVASLFGYLPQNGVAIGAWTGEQLSGSTNYPNSGAPSPLNSSALPLLTGGSGDETVGELAADLPNNATDSYAGLYQLRLYTSAPSKSQTTTYDSADIQITGSTWSVVYPAPTLTSTTTTLTTTQTSPQLAGTSITLNAAVSPAAGGTVQFKDGTTNIGTPVTVTGGAASISTTTLAVGTHTLHAVFTPSAFSAFGGSTGDDSFTINAPPAAGTTTALSVNPTSAPAFTAVTLTANVTKTSDSSALASGTGTVKFYDNGTTLLGSDAVGTGGAASLTYSAFSVGAHSITAQFVPSDPTTLATSTSPSVAFNASAPASAPAAQTVDVDIPAGTLTITTPYDTTHPFDLGTAVLDPSDGKFTATKPFGSPSNPANGVTITDTRAGEQPWTASATVTDFTDGATPPDVINGQNLTFTGVTPVYLPGNALQSGVVATDVTNSAIYGPTDTGSDGLKGGPHEFATIPHGDGEVNIDGQLTLTAPTSTPSGEYTATLTFTIA